MHKRLSVTFVSLVAIGVPAFGCGDDRREPAEVQTVVDRRPTPAGVLPCTETDEPTNFDVYSVGKRFEGLPLTHQERMCTQAPSRAPPQARANDVLYVYGDCEIPPEQEEGGCMPPLSVQSWPRCERSFSPHSSREFTIRGVPARYQGGGLTLLTGDAMVSLFGTDEDHMLRAARALVRAPAKPSDPVKDEVALGALPPPEPRRSGCASRKTPRPPQPRLPAPSHEPPNLPTAPSEPPGKGEPAFPPAPVHRDPPSPSSATPEEARESMAHQQRAERARRLPRTRQAGCEKAVFPLKTPRVIWSPPRPALVAARHLGKRITVSFEFNQLPRSPACRPHMIRVTILSGKRDTRWVRLAEGEFRVAGLRSTGTVRVPAGVPPPYSVRIETFNINHKPSEPVEARVR